jgi:hypothetical protein
LHLYLKHNLVCYFRLFSVMQILEGLFKTFSTARNKRLAIPQHSRVDHDNVPKYYYYGPRLTQILHARLRMRSSSLNWHLYIKNIIDSPNCFCGEIESTHHYLFKYPKYTHQRNSLFRKLLQLLNIRPSENLLLFGSPDLDIDSNTIVFTTVHKYISQSKRFW